MIIRRSQTKLSLVASPSDLRPSQPQHPSARVNEYLHTTQSMRTFWNHNICFGPFSPETQTCRRCSIGTDMHRGLPGVALCLIFMSSNVRNFSSFLGSTGIFGLLVRMDLGEAFVENAMVGKFLARRAFALVFLASFDSTQGFLQLWESIWRCLPSYSKHGSISMIPFCGSL